MAHPPFPHHPSETPPGQANPPVGSNAGYSWLFGLLVLLFVPLLSSIVAGVVMAVYSRAEAKRAPSNVARQNANRAGNWGLTYLTITVILAAVHIVGLITLQGRPILEGFLPWGFIALSWVALSIVHVVFSFVGMAVARRGKLVRINGIPFFR